MNDETTIVTAFFPIQREKWRGFERGDLKYLEYFKFWACIKNDLIIYTTPEYEKAVLDIRKSYGRDNTKVIVIKKIEDIDKEIFECIKKVSENELSTQFHINSTFPESWNPYYNYVVILKEWCVQDAVKNNPKLNYIVWIDFGFNHGGEYYTNSGDFDFELKIDNLKHGKIHLFTINDIDYLPVFETVRRMDSFIQGNFICGEASLWNQLWNIMRENIIALGKVGLMDDDQTILLMAYYQEPELFELHKTNRWFDEFSFCCPYKNFEVKKEKEKSFLFFRKLKRRALNRIKMKKYTNKWYKILRDNEMKG